MGLSGNLQTMSAGDLLQWASLARKSGTLLVCRTATEKRIYFRHGRILSSASNDPREYLGQFLMSHGYITEEELSKAMQVQNESGMLLGKILVTIGVIDETDLLRLMRLKAEETIYDLFLWNEGTFEFDDDQLPSAQLVPLSVDMTGLMMEGSRRADEWKLIREAIPSDSLIPVPKKTIVISEGDEQVRRVAQAIDGKRSIADIMLESRATSFAVNSTIRNLLEANALTLVERVREPHDQESREIKADDDGHDPVDSLLQQGQKHLRAEHYEQAIRSFRAAQELDPKAPKVRKVVTDAELAIGNVLKQRGIQPNMVPELTRPVEEILEMDLSPNEGFVISRIDGHWDLGSILKVSPIREIDGLLIFHDLRERGVIELRNQPSKSA